MFRIEGRSTCHARAWEPIRFRDTRWADQPVTDELPTRPREFHGLQLLLHACDVHAGARRPEPARVPPSVTHAWRPPLQALVGSSAVLTLLALLISTKVMEQVAIQQEGARPRVTRAPRTLTNYSHLMVSAHAEAKKKQQALRRRSVTRRLNALRTAQMIAKNRKEWRIRSLIAIEQGAASMGSRTWKNAKHSVALGASRRFLEHIPHTPHAIAALAVAHKTALAEQGDVGAVSAAGATAPPTTQKT